MDTQVDLYTPPKTAEIYRTCPLQISPKNPHFDSVQNHHTKQESVKKAVVSAFPQTPRFAAHGHGISKVNNSKRKTPQEGSKFIPAVKESAFVKACIAQGVPEYEAGYKKLVGDALTLSKMEVHKLYPSESNSLRDRKRAAKEQHIHFDKRLTDIRDWLIHLGPKPSGEHTVDRIKSEKAIGYRPGNIRWATKYTQTINRAVTKWHKMPEGPDLTTKQLAKRLGIPYDTLHKRFARGWEMERLLGEHPRKIEDWTFPHELAEYCESLYPQRKHFTTNRLDWFITHLEYLFHGDLKGNGANLEGQPLPRLRKHLDQAKTDRRNIVQAQKTYEERKLKELVAIYEPTAQAISQPVPANDTSPAQALPVVPQVRLDLPRPVAPEEQPYRHSASEIAETFAQLAKILAARAD